MVRAALLLLMASLPCRAVAERVPVAVVLGVQTPTHPAVAARWTEHLMLGLLAEGFEVVGPGDVERAHGAEVRQALLTCVTSGICEAAPSTVISGQLFLAITSVFEGGKYQAELFVSEADGTRQEVLKTPRGSEFLIAERLRSLAARAGEPVTFDRGAAGNAYQAWRETGTGLAKAAGAVLAVSAALTFDSVRRYRVIEYDSPPPGVAFSDAAVGKLEMGAAIVALGITVALVASSAWAFSQAEPKVAPEALRVSLAFGPAGLVLSGVLP